MANITPEALIEKIEQARGNISAVARAFGVTRRTIYKRIMRNATAQKALEDARETMLDEAESVLYTKALEGSTPELIFFLKTQGRRRGYVERQEITGAEGGPLEVEFDYSKFIRSATGPDGHR
jgi:transposase-like protein